MSRAFNLRVITACTGVFTASLFLSAVIAYPSRLRAKLVGIPMVIAGVFALNLARLITLFFIGIHVPDAFDIMHLLVWRAAIVFFGLLIWLFWVERFARAPAAS